MSTFGSGMADVRRSRDIAGDVRRDMARSAESIGTLDAPGGVATPYVAQTFVNDSELQDLYAALGVAGQGAENIARGLSQFAQVDRGLGNRFANEQWPVLQQRIRDRSLLPPDGADPIEWSRHIADGLAPEGVSAAYKEALVGRLSPMLTEAALNEQAKIKTESQADLMDALGDGLAGQEDQAEFGTALARAEGMGVPRELAIRDLGLRAAAFSAEAGDQAGFNASLEFLGGREQVKVERLRARLHESIRAEEQQVRRDASGELDTMLLEVRDPTSGRNWSDARALVEEHRADAGDSWAIDRLREIDGMEASYGAEARKEMVQAFNAARRTEIVQAATDASFRTDTSLGLAAVPDDGVRWTDPSGVERSITAKEIKATAMDAAFARIEAEEPDTGRRFSRQADWLAVNGMTNPAWSNVMEAGASSAAAVFNRRDSRGQVPKELPQPTIAGYELAKNLRAADPALWGRHLSSEAQQFYLRAQLAEQYVDRGDARAALMRAADVPATPPSERVTEHDMRSVLEFARGTVNEGDVGAHVRDVAEMLMRSPGLGKAKAIEQAGKLVKEQYRDIRGTMVWTGNARVPQSIGSIANTLAEKYADYVKDSVFEVNADNLTLVPMRDGELWTLFDTSRMRPVDKWDHGYVLTNDELVELDAAARAKADDERQAAVDAAWELIRAPKVTDPFTRETGLGPNVVGAKLDPFEASFGTDEVYRMLREAGKNRRNAEFAARRNADQFRSP